MVLSPNKKPPKVVGGSPRKDTGIMTDKRNTEK
jgi:hypothetical protein